MRITKFLLSNFWSWAYSDTLSSSIRGELAEYLVACDLGLSAGVKEPWAPIDHKMEEGHRVEVKSSSYLQSWFQERYSVINFDIAKKKAWDYTKGKHTEIQKRHADVYVFCLLDHKDKSTVDPLNLEQWKFFILKTSILDQKLGDQKKLGLKNLLNLNPEQVRFGEMKETILMLMDNA